MPWLTIQHNTLLIKWIQKWTFRSKQHGKMAMQAIVKTIKHSIGSYDKTADEKLLEAVLAHLTIMKILSLIKHRMTFTKTNLQSTDQARCWELKVLSALATILARNGEVVAVAKSDEGSGDLNVIVSAQLVRDEERCLTTKHGCFGEHVWTVFANGNPCAEMVRKIPYDLPATCHPFWIWAHLSLNLR